MRYIAWAIWMFVGLAIWNYDRTVWVLMWMVATGLALLVKMLDSEPMWVDGDD